MAMETTSFSEIRLARKCLRAHHYRYKERLRRKRPSRPGFVGTILHEMLDARVRSQLGEGDQVGPWDVYRHYKKKYKKLFREEQEEFGDVPALVKSIYKGYWRRWKDDGLVYVASEVEFRVPLTDKIELLGYIDKIVEDIHQRRFVMDHKFHRVIPGPEDRFSDIQTVLYLWAWNLSQEKEDRVDGVLWDYGRMKAPTVPEVLKNGELSKRANIDTDVHTYREAIRENGLHEKPYRAFLKGLEGKDRTFFERVPLPAPSKHLIGEVVEDARQWALIAKKALRTGKAPRSQSGFNCNRCEFRTLCEAEVRGLDHKFIRKKDYEIREENPKEKKYGEVDEAA